MCRHVGVLSASGVFTRTSFSQIPDLSRKIGKSADSMTLKKTGKRVPSLPEPYDDLSSAMPQRCMLRSSICRLMGLQSLPSQATTIYPSFGRISFLAVWHVGSKEYLKTACFMAENHGSFRSLMGVHGLWACYTDRISVKYRVLPLRRRRERHSSFQHAHGTGTATVLAVIFILTFRTTHYITFSPTTCGRQSAYDLRPPPKSTDTAPLGRPALLDSLCLEDGVAAEEGGVAVSSSPFPDGQDRVRLRTSHADKSVLRWSAGFILFPPHGATGVNDAGTPMTGIALAAV
ncbi:uncharacterized protein F5147DRAFT_652343 [Suillus discolor]|uniref:Uncharacterized protein n=1 Tax=Suillus discolor TaxID=1912936 RepID=A0A9P7F6Z4_9AGAM|nr:uncharacterized protein F5147DRAFT_652343 [Suillus discolor]KAG2109242.1 hypothetical protein F5147DRAFT_652343 [Suillus discolor]